MKHLIKFINQKNYYKNPIVNQKTKQKKQINIIILYNNKNYIFQAKIYNFKKMKINIKQNNRI